MKGKGKMQSICRLSNYMIRWELQLTICWPKSWKSVAIQYDFARNKEWRFIFVHHHNITFILFHGAWRKDESVDAFVYENPHKKIVTNVNDNAKDSIQASTIITRNEMTFKERPRLDNGDALSVVSNDELTKMMGKTQTNRIKSGPK